MPRGKREWLLAQTKSSTTATEAGENVEEAVGPVAFTAVGEAGEKATGHVTPTARSYQHGDVTGPPAAKDRPYPRWCGYCQKSLPAFRET